MTLSALVLGTTAFAKADTLSITGSDTYTSTTITFTSLGSIGGASTGIFSAFLPCNQCVTMTPSLTYAGYTGTFAPQQIFSATDGGNIATLTLNDITSATDTVAVLGDATVVVNGASYLGTLKLTTQEGEDGSNVTFSATTKVPTAAAPEPSSFLLLGTGLLSAAGIARRKFRA